MLMKKEKRLITVALPYTNNVPHIGNIVGSHLPGDIFARYCRLIGHDAILIGGTDDHGTAAEIAAQKYNITPKELANFFYKIHKDIYDWFNINYDNFSRTSKKIHHETTKEFFMEMYKKGHITEKMLKLPYCTKCDKQLSDRYIEGTCPECGQVGARGDQCEKCSALLEPIDLIKPYCAICKSNKIVFKEKKHLFFSLDKLSKKLEKWIKPNKIWRPQVKNLALSWIKSGLKSRCVSRDLKWGIDIPLKEYKGLKLYVWFEAPIGYISSTKEWHKTKWKQYWTNKDAKMYHFIGKDNIPFHTIFFPGELLANGKYNLPYNVVGLQYLNYERSKFSKSKNWGVFCENLPGAGLDVDYWRFYLSYLIPETKDTEFLWDDFQLRINTELIGNFGNFINRTLSFVKNYFDKKIPQVVVKDKKFLKTIEKQIDVIVKDYENVDLRKSLLEILKLSDMGNKYFEKKEPWKTKDPEIVFIGANLCKSLALLIQPFLPGSSDKILKILNCKETDWKKIKKFNLKNHKIKEPYILFKKIESDKIEELKEKTSKVTKYFKEKPTEEEKMPEEKELKVCDKISFSEFQKIDLRVGKVIKIKPHPKADKLYILIVNIGKGEQDIQLVAGLKPYYKEEEILGKQVIVVKNLQPAVLRGVESQGMLLAAEFKDKVVLLSPEKEIETGAKIR